MYDVHCGICHIRSDWLWRVCFYTGAVQRRMALMYKQKYEDAMRLQEVWKSSAMKRGETDAEEPPES